MPDPLRHSWRWWQTLTEASSGEWPAGGERGCVLCGGEEKSSRVLLRRQKTDSHGVKRWFSFRHLQAPSFYVEMRHVWPLQCKWDLNMELEASSQAQCDCSICVYDCLTVFSLSVSSPGQIDMPCQPVCVTIVSHFPPLSFPEPSELFSLALTGRV